MLKIIPDIHARAEVFGGGVPVLDVKLVVARLLNVVDLPVLDSRVGVEEGVLHAYVGLTVNRMLSAPRMTLRVGEATDLRT